MYKRAFLIVLSAAVVGVIGLATPSVARPDDVHVLKSDDLERLKLDFNAHRQKVRLLFILSPT